MNHLIDRRDFLRKGAAAGLGLGLAAAFPTVLRAAPSNRVRLAVIGTNNRGLDHLQSLSGIDNAEIAYICDVDDRALAKGVREAATLNLSPKTLRDFRRALDDKSIDAVTIAVPDHWHTPMAILALSAGKHVYLEKPCSQNPREGEILLSAIGRHDRLVQMGNQRRSFPNMQVAIGEIREESSATPTTRRRGMRTTAQASGTGPRCPFPPGSTTSSGRGRRRGAPTGAT